VHGPVGCGKTMLMDMFCASLRDELSGGQGDRVRRVHFHSFMLEVHQGIHRLRTHDLCRDGRQLQRLASHLAEESSVLCFDEFQVTDVADAMILKELFSCLFSHGVVVVATSNRAPSDLYENGINRSLFLPFISLLARQCETLDMSLLQAAPLQDFRMRNAHKDQSQKSSYSHPNDMKSLAWFEALFRDLGRASTSSPEAEICDRHLVTAHNRLLQVPNTLGRVCRFEFDDLCRKPLGAADYLALAENFDAVFVAGVPRLSSTLHNETRRFIILVDILYERGRRLVLTADVPLEALFEELPVHSVPLDDAWDVDISKRPPARTLAYEEVDWSHLSSVGSGAHVGAVQELRVSDSGGASSGRHTTYMGDNVEWSATGRLGVSLAELSAVQDVGFAFHRAFSRLVEMQSQEYLNVAHERPASM